MPTSPPPDARSRAARRVATLLPVSAVLAVAAWWFIEEGTRVGHLIAWSCWGGECSTNDARAVLPIVGIFLNIGLLVALTALARAFGFGLAVMTGPLAALRGWSEAVAEGTTTPAAIGVEQRIVAAVAALGALVALLGLFSELKTTGYGAVLTGAKRVPATLADFGAAEGDYGRVSANDAAALGFGTATLVFTDNGRYHRVKVRAREQWVDTPVYAVFRETRPERARIGLPWTRSYPAPEKPESGAAAVGSGGSIVSELERLTALRSQGHLTQEEFEAAKRRLLGN
ncbi:SHOCT domain-containing protein [Glycomyces sp. NPDC047010]|uniref:SHOCT domain-containing protein n=1 Tax=Glycomyces sp. NPDC047010 TaxID=3155023 RepID=UPI0033E4A6D3